MGQFNSKSAAGTAKFRRVFSTQQNLDEMEQQNIKAETYNLKFQYIKVKENPAMINILELLAIEYAKDNEMELYNFL